MKRAAPAARPETETETQEDAMTRILRNVEAKLLGEDMKATLGDYIRLVQLEKAMAEPKTEIKVTWVEPPEERTGK